MKEWAGKILVPAIIVALAAVQSFGIDAGRAIRYSRADLLGRGPATQAVDSLEEAADTTAARDTLLEYTDTAATDSLTEATDSADAQNNFTDTTDTNTTQDNLTDTTDSLAARDSLSEKADTTAAQDSTADRDSLDARDTVYVMDSIETRLLDSLYSMDSSETARLLEKTKYLAREIMIAPDSLRLTDSLKYKYYIAIKDSLARGILRDSLIASEDTIQLRILDSLYTKDSAEVADAKFLAWYTSLTKKERKKYDTEQAFQKKLAEVNAKVAMKDSLKYIRDSTIEATPRILETYAVPDSMQYKRLITWQHDRKFNDLELNELDTSYNYHFHDLPPLQKDLATTSLGVAGSASQAYNYFKREKTENAVFYDAYADYTYSAENLPMYNTKTPYTELAYWGTLLGKQEKEETNVRVMTTQNILPSLNVTLEYDRFGGKGMLQDETTDNRTFVAAGNYLGKRYLMHAGYIYNRVKRTENGGLTDSFWIRDTMVDAKEINVNLTSADSKIKQNTIFLDQSYRIPFNFIRNIQNGVYKQRKADKALRDSLLKTGDSLAIEEALAMDLSRDKGAQVDSIDRDVTSAFIGHSSEYSVYTRNYSDAISASDETGRAFYNDNFLINPTSTADSMRVMRFENRVYIRIQPWKEDGIVSKLDIGIGDKLLNYYDYGQNNYFYKKNNTSLNSVYLYAGVKGQYKNIFSWDATGDYTFLGHEINDFGVKANIEFNWYPFRKDRYSPLTIQAHFETSLREPDHYQQKLYTNHYKWDNSFGKISTTKVWGRLSIPMWKLEAEFDYALLSNNIYYDADGIVRQNGTAMSVMTASLMKNFKLWLLHFDHRVLFQVSSNDDVVPLPMLTANLRYYLQFDVVKGAMQMQLGAEGRWFTKWYMQGYNPALGVFYNQKEEQYGNYPVLDAFVNIQWKRACIFIKVVNVSEGWPKHNLDYFSAHHYINSQRVFKFGVFWPFYIQPAKDTGLGAKAAAGGAAPGGGKRGEKNTGGKTMAK